MSDSIIEKDAITITRKLVQPKREDQDHYVTRVPYTHEYVRFPKENCKWITEKTMKVRVEDNMVFDYWTAGASNPVPISGAALKEHYDEVIKRAKEQEQSQNRPHGVHNLEEVKLNVNSFEGEAKYYKDKLDAAASVDEIETLTNTILTESNIEPEKAYALSDYADEKAFLLGEKDRVIDEAKSLDTFDRQVYHSESILKYYPNQLRNNADFVTLLDYQNQQQIYLKDYMQRNNPEQIVACQKNLKAVDMLITDKADAYVKEFQSRYQEDMKGLSNYSPANIDVEAYRKYPAELQRDTSFKQLVLYKSQLEDYRNNLVNVLNTNTDNLYAAQQSVTPDVLLQYEKTIKAHEPVLIQKIADATDRIHSIDFCVQQQVSHYQEVKPLEIPATGETMLTLNMRTTNQLPQLLHDRTNLQHLGKMVGDVGIFQTPDCRNFVGRTLQNGKVQQIGKADSLREISKSFKNYAHSCKQELSQQRQQAKSMDRGR